MNKNFELCVICGCPITKSIPPVCYKCKIGYQGATDKIIKNNPAISNRNLFRKLFREKNNNTDYRYMLTDIPDKIISQLRAATSTSNDSIRDILLKSIVFYLADGDPLNNN